jgi:hypothetical protein
MNYLVSAFGHNGYVPVYEVRQNNKPERIMDPKNDIYPPPLSRDSKSYQVKGFSKLLFATWYLQPERLRELIIQHQDDYLKIKEEDMNTNYATKEEIYEMLKTHQYSYEGSNEYLKNDKVDIYSKCGAYGNILCTLSQGSLPSNIPHSMNEFLFDRMFMTVIKSLKIENIPHMINDLNEGFPDYESHLYKFILLNFGATVNNLNEFLTRMKRAYMHELDENYIDNILSFYKEKLKIVLDSKYPIGKKLLSLVEHLGYCPLTYEEFKYPVIIEDGTVYEKKAIMEWFEKSNRSPLTGIELKRHWIMYSIIENEIIYANNSKIFPKEVQKYVK